MGRFDQHGLSRFRARDAIWTTFFIAALLIVTAGDSVEPGSTEAPVPPAGPPVPVRSPREVC